MAKPIRTCTSTVLALSAITEQRGLVAWWTEETIAAPEVGAILEFKFGDRYHNEMEVLELVPGRRVSWICLVGDEEWVDTHFTFTLEEKDGRTVLRFSHENWRDETDFLASCNYQWGYYLRSLKQYCETGQGTPFSAD